MGAMTPKDRMISACRGSAVDRVSLELAGLQAAGIDEISAETDPRKRDLLHRALPHTHSDVEVPSFINGMFVTPPDRIRISTQDLATGQSLTTGVISTPTGDLTFATRFDPVVRTTWQIEYPVKPSEDIRALASVPWELPGELTPPPPSPPREPGRSILTARLSSPFVCVAGAMSLEMFLELCARGTGLLRELTEMCTQRILDCVDVLSSRRGIERWWIGGSEWVTPPTASPEVYEVLVQEQEARIIEVWEELSSI